MKGLETKTNVKEKGNTLAFKYQILVVIKFKIITHKFEYNLSTIKFKLRTHHLS